MSKLKTRYEFIIGYVAIIISLSAFKEELGSFNLDLGYIEFSASNYLFSLILGSLLGLHIYIVPFLFSSTKYANLRIFSLLENISYTFFIFLALSPFLVGFSILINNSLKVFISLPNIVVSIITGIIGVITGVMAQFLSQKYIRQKNIDRYESLENQEIVEIEKSQKLFNDGYYSQSIVEAFKVLEIHLKRILSKKNVYFKSHRFNDLIAISTKLQIINDSDISRINEIRKMRNSAAHLDIDFTKQQAGDTLEFIKVLIINANEKYAS